MSKSRLKKSENEYNIVDLIKSGVFHNCFYIHSKKDYNSSKRYFDNPKYMFIISNRISEYNPHDFQHNNYFLDYSIEQIIYPGYWRDTDKELTYLNKILPSFKKRIDNKVGIEGNGDYSELLPNQLKELFNYSEIAANVKKKGLINNMSPALFLNRLSTKFELDNLALNKKINQAIGGEKIPYTVPINIRIFNRNHLSELNRLKKTIITGDVLYLKFYNFSLNSKNASIAILKKLNSFFNYIKSRIPLIIVNGLGTAGLYIKAKNIIPAFRLNYPGLTLRENQNNNNFFIPPMFFCPYLGTYFLRRMCRDKFNCKAYKRCEQKPNLGKIVKMKRNIDVGFKIKPPNNLKIYRYTNKIKLRAKIATIM